MLVNVDCHHIKVTSELLTEYIGNPELYSKLEVTVKKNCCADSSKTETILLDGTEWSIEMFTAAEEAGAYNYTFKVVNIFTGEEHIVVSSSYDTQNCTLGFATVEADITQWLLDHGQAPGPSYSSSVVNGKCVFTVSGLLFPFAFTIMQYDKPPVTGAYEKQFKYGSSSQNTFISGDSLYISPGIFGLEEFGNGIYTVDLTLTSVNNSVSEDTQCGFVDCDLKCQVAEKLETLKEDSLIHIMYQALVEASNCSCQCDKLCKLYEELLQELGQLPQNSDCGC